MHEVFDSDSSRRVSCSQERSGLNLSETPNSRAPARRRQSFMVGALMASLPGRPKTEELSNNWKASKRPIRERRLEGTSCLVELNQGVANVEPFSRDGPVSRSSLARCPRQSDHLCARR